MAKVKVKIRLADVRPMDAILQKLGESENGKLVWDLSDNRLMLDPLIKRLQMAETPPKKFKEYEDKKLKVFQKHSRRDGAGFPVPPQTVSNADGSTALYFDIVDQEACDKDQMALKKKHKPAIDANDRRIAGLESVYNEEVEVEFITITRDQIDVPLKGNEIAALRLYQILEEPVPVEEASEDAVAEV